MVSQSRETRLVEILRWETTGAISGGQRILLHQNKAFAARTNVALLTFHSWPCVKASRALDPSIVQNTATGCGADNLDALPAAIPISDAFY
jgi:hypothetical protein